MDKIRLSLFLCTLGVVSATQVACSSSLNEAAKRGDCAEVEQLLRAGANVNAVDMYGDTALHLAARYAHEQVVERLLQAGANVRIAAVWGNTALHMAGNCAIVQRLVQAGADVNVANREGDIALHSVASCGYARVIDQLLRKDAIIGAAKMALPLAALKGHESAVNFAIVQRLVQAGADFEVLNNQRESSLVKCASFGIWKKWSMAKVIGYLISIGAGIDDVLHSYELRWHLRPHVDLIKDRAAFLRDLLDEKQGVYSDLQGLIGQHAGFPITEKAVGKMEAILLRDLIEDFVGDKIRKEVVGIMEACLQ